MAIFPVTHIDGTRFEEAAKALDRLPSWETDDGAPAASVTAETCVFTEARAARTRVWKVGPRLDPGWTERVSKNDESRNHL